MTATRTPERQAMLDELDLRRHQMDCLSGEFYEQAHERVKTLVKALLADAGLQMRLGKTYTSHAGRCLRRVDISRDGELLRTVDVPNGPAAYVRAFAIVSVSR